MQGRRRINRVSGIVASGLGPCRWGALALGLIAWAGCTGRPAPVPVPEWDVEAMSAKAISDNDQNGDGKLSLEELQAVPGLAWSLQALDTDGDKQLSKEEILERIKLYEQMKTGLTTYQLQFFHRRRPLRNAEVKLVPEAFLGDVVKTATCRTQPNGLALPAVPGEEQDPCMQIGFYRIEVTSSDVEIPDKYNTNTTIGVEVAPVTDPYHSGIPTFDVGR